ncbi:hypothetical protein U9M48_029670 [Paspalum notatum var. saurae]|uniref:F-box domain-containing protein n=1 Tax=Paspalum notatum var. saurae TaxID=547442 RepID=A0AAQ3U1F0_PASNO
MDSMAEKEAKRVRRLSPSESEYNDGGVDLISGLDDDVLLRVLGQMADARDVVRAGAASRRWLGLSTRVPALRFRFACSSPDRSEANRAILGAALERYVSFVNGVLARRRPSTSAAIESLSISCTTGTYASIDAAGGWIRYAFQHGVRHFVLELPDLIRGPKAPHHHKIRIAHGPLSLEKITFDAGAVELLPRLISTEACPHLQKLRMVGLLFRVPLQEMRLETDVLSELWLQRINGVKAYQLRTPRLQVLHIDDCSRRHQVLRVSAPRLEKLTLLYYLEGPPRLVELDGDLPRLRSLGICIWSYFPHSFLQLAEAVNHASNKLLLKLGDVCLHGRKASEEDVEILRSMIPHLPHVTSLTANVSIPIERHDFGASVAALLTRFSNLTRFSLHLPSYLSLEVVRGERHGLECHHQSHWISNEISMSHLQEVEFTGLIGTECELWFMKDMLASARGIRKVAIHFNPKCWQHQAKMDAFERMLLDQEMWTSHRGAFKLTCLK